MRLDTNVLIYQLDRRDKGKQKKYRDLLKTLVTNHEAVISTQVLQEFFFLGPKQHLRRQPQRFVLMRLLTNKFRLSEWLYESQDTRSAEAFESTFLADQISVH
jgi:predicted nucleic acid-binding protein